MLPVEGQTVNNNRMTVEGRLVAEALDQDEDDNGLLVAEARID